MIRKYNLSLLTQHAVNKSFFEFFDIQVLPSGEPLHNIWPSRGLNFSSPELQNYWLDDGGDSLF